MATIKVFDVNGVKELQCFDNLSQVDYEKVEVPEDFPFDVQIDEKE